MVRIINISSLLIIGAIAIILINPIVGQSQSTTQITEWYGSTNQGWLRTLESSTPNNYINEIWVGVHWQNEMNIGGIEAHFTDNSRSEWSDGSILWYYIFDVNDGECISKVILTHDDQCCPHSLQFESTDSQLSRVWGASSLGAHVIITYGVGYCMSKIDVQSDGNFRAIRFHFIENQHTKSPSPAPTNIPTPAPSVPTKAPTKAPTAPTNSPIALSPTQISEWYGWPHSDGMTTLGASTTDNFINKISVGVHPGFSNHVDIGGVIAYFTDNSNSKWESESSQNDFSSFTVNNGECISKVLLTHNSNCCPHSLQFETTDSQLSPVWGSSFLGARVIINYGHQYCLSKIDILGEESDNYISGIRFHFILHPNSQSPPPTKNPTPAPTNLPISEPTAPSKAPTIRPIAVPTNNPTPAPTNDPTPTPTNNPTRTPTVPSEAPTKAPTPAPTATPTKTQLQGPKTVVLSSGGAGVPLLAYKLINCVYEHSAVPGADIEVTGEIESVSGDAAGAVGDAVSFSAAASFFGGEVAEFGPMASMTIAGASGAIIVAHQAFTAASGDGDDNPPSGNPSPEKQPTPKPTAKPTEIPTPAPTNNPSPAPTSNPTPAPTDNPSPTPTSAPTPTPTNNPSPAPTSAPTPTPTSNPTSAPTPTPTRNPTTSPTPAPTNSPTAPSKSPTSSPTPAPTSNPTSAPTPAPTSDPSPAPTNAPTVTTKSPTNAPTPSPTNNPTSAPTPAPTTNPTNAPTPTPTSNPTPAPTGNPTAAPSPAPTSNPTAAPTPAPTSNPTAAPTPAPTNNPIANLPQKLCVNAEGHMALDGEYHLITFEHGRYYKQFTCLGDDECNAILEPGNDGWVFRVGAQTVLSCSWPFPQLVNPAECSWGENTLVSPDQCVL